MGVLVRAKVTLSRSRAGKPGQVGGGSGAQVSGPTATSPAGAVKVPSPEVFSRSAGCGR